MTERYRPEFEGAYLEDSYVLGFHGGLRFVRIDCLFALTNEHDAYQTPRANEQHCYANGSIFIESSELVSFKPGTPSLTTDANGEIDFGSLELFDRSDGTYRVVTEWFELLAAKSGLRIEFFR